MKEIARCVAGGDAAQTVIAEAEDGAIRIDNNSTEAALKGPVMGKKAWLFLGNEESGEAAAILYTLTMTCKRHCIDVEAYLRDVFQPIAPIHPWASAS